jgi:putative transposase
MAQNYYAEINLHITWHTKDNAPMLNADVETLVHRHLRKKALEARGVVVHAIGGTDDHVHIAASIPPTLLISDWVGQLKGSSSHEANQRLGLRGKVLEWQAGYGVVSFGIGDLHGWSGTSRTNADTMPAARRSIGWKGSPRTMHEA